MPYLLKLVQTRKQNKTTELSLQSHSRVRLGKNSGFPTGITKNNSREKFDKGFFIKESINEANPEAMVGKKLGTLLKSLDKTVAQYKKKANVKSHMNFFEAGVKSVMRKHGIM